MDVILLILLVVGAVCFIAAAFFGWGGSPRMSWARLIAIGLLCWLLVDLVLRAQAMS